MAVKVAVLGLCVVLAIAVASAFLTSTSAASTRPSESPDRQVIEPVMVMGYVYESDGATPVFDCLVNITNKNTGEWALTYTDPVYGWYQFAFYNFQDGDTFNVTATKNIQIGWNEAVWHNYYPYLQIDVTLSGAIPEFGSVLVSVLGLVCVVVLASAAQRSRHGH